MSILGSLLEAPGKILDLTLGGLVDAGPRTRTFYMAAAGVAFMLALSGGGARGAEDVDKK